MDFITETARALSTRSSSSHSFRAFFFLLLFSPVCVCYSSLRLFLLGPWSASPALCSSRYTESRVLADSLSLWPYLMFGSQPQPTDHPDKYIVMGCFIHRPGIVLEVYYSVFCYFCCCQERRIALGLNTRSIRCQSVRFVP